MSDTPDSVDVFSPYLQSGPAATGISAGHFPGRNRSWRNCIIGVQLPIGFWWDWYVYVFVQQ